MKFKSLLLLVGFIPALAMAEVAKPTAPEKAPPVVARPVVVETQVAKPALEKAPPVVARPVVGVTHVYHHHYHHRGPHYYEKHPNFMIPDMYYEYQSGAPQIPKPTMEGGAREIGMPPEGYYVPQYHWRRME